ncbi:alginate export family protein [Gallaecimonas mangrovi]|uniref:alginate export family protein n=1 Tax=Gallaecimonas mangrovi TaxID=2291597 RepID=UPI000E205B73|nr:alginate export family protein [Gallaecimonas mangrovi]
MVLRLGATLISVMALSSPTLAETLPIRPAIQSDRWQEDWSALANPALRTAPLDNLKYLPLTANPKDYLSFGANLRERYESNHAAQYGVEKGSGDNYLINRIEAHSDLHLGQWQGFLQLQQQTAPGKKHKGGADINKLDVEQAFVALVQAAGAGTLKLRAGRQQFAFDLQRFVSVREGPNVRRSFDALWGDYETTSWRWIAYYSQPVTNKAAKRFDDSSNNSLQFYGLRVERHVFGQNELSAYWSRYHNQHSQYLTVAGNEQRDVWDLRFAGKTARLTWDNEVMLQSGHVGNVRIRAWALGSRVSLLVSHNRWQPRLGMQLDAASGDKHPNDHRLGTFNPLFPNGSYLNLAGYSSYVNIIHIKPFVSTTLTPALSLLAAIAGQWRMTTADAIYTQPNNAIANSAGRGQRWIGAYGQLRANWQVNRNLSSALEIVHFDAASTVKALGGHNSNYLGLQLKFSW